jgi:hypothetical protein
MKNVKYFQVCWTLKSCVSDNGHEKLYVVWSSYSPQYKKIGTALKHLARYKSKEWESNITHTIRACGSNGYNSGIFKSFLPYRLLER